MKAILKNMTIFIMIVAIAYGCAAKKAQSDFDTESEPTASEDMDSLFGISEEEKSDTSTDGDEEEVLRLLGISKDENETSQVSEQPQIADDENETRLQNEISNLEQQLMMKENEIADLKANISEKDQKINKLEMNATLQPESKPNVFISGDFMQDYQNAFSKYQNKQYKQAITLFEDLLARGANNSYVDNCQYWIGESYYGLGNFNQAIVEFTKVFSYSKSNKNDDAQLKLGLCYWKLGDKQKAREELERLMSDFPRSEYVEKAEYYLSRL